MLFDISDLGPQGVWLNERVEVSALEGGPAEGAHFEPARVTGTLRPTAEGVEFSGRFETEAHLVCSRCVKGFTRELSGTFSLLLVAPEAAHEDVDHDAGGAPVEVEMDEDAEDVYRLDEPGVVDLEAVVREQLDLALPLRAVCSEECKGLCPGCGADLNHEACRCQREIDDRWSALRELKERLDHGSTEDPNGRS